MGTAARRGLLACMVFTLAVLSALTLIVGVTARACSKLEATEASENKPPPLPRPHHSPDHGQRKAHAWSAWSMCHTSS